MTGGPLRRLQELAAGFPFRSCHTCASDQGGESGGPPSACNQHSGGGLYSEVMTKWEYVTVPLLVHATKQILDNWGQDGWELVQVVPGLNPENLVAYLKRPIPAPGAGA
jgi:hypothetical protein